MAEIINYRCPNCGGEIAFHAGKQKLTCEYCDSEFTVDALEEYRQQLIEQQKQAEEAARAGQEAQTGQSGWQAAAPEQEESSWEDGDFNEYVCGSCGGTIICDANTAATTCPYCDSPVVIRGRVSGALKPDFVIPFTYDKKQAVEEMKKHFKGKLLLPKSFKTGHKIEEIKGIYVPFWLFDSSATAQAEFKATRSHSWTSGGYRYTRTDIYKIYRDGFMRFDKIPADGSERMDDTYMEAIEPYDYSKLIDFKPGYLAGFMADKYDVEAESCKPRIDSRIQTAMGNRLKQEVSGYATCELSSIHVSHADRRVRYALMPVWIVNTKYRDKLYRFAMNGQTGKFVGKLPMSPGRAVILFLVSLIATIPIGYFCAELLHILMQML